jgi:iron complex outermembrane recepter protein
MIPDMRSVACSAALIITAPAIAEEAPPASADAESVIISAERDSAVPHNTPSPTFGISEAALQSITVVNTEDALKYAPNLHVRKRYIGDNNGVVSVRSTSSRQSARTLVYADGLLLSNFLGSDFGFPPRWSMVSAPEVRRVDVLYGPYSARFPGNSLGATVLISTAMPQRFQIAGGAQYFNQSFDLYGVDQSFEGHKVHGFIGNRTGDWSYLLSVERLDTQGQPLSFLTALRSNVAAGPGDIPVSGAVPYSDQLGRAGYVLGVNSEGVTDTVNDQVKLKVSYDITQSLQLALTAVDWRQDISNATGSFLTAADGNIVSTGNVAIDGNRYTLVSNAFAPGVSESRRRLWGLSLRGREQAGWSYSLTASRFETVRDIARTASGPGEGAGAVAFGDGSGWTTLDLDADYRPTVLEKSHWIAFGLHGDRYELKNSTWDTADWRSGAPSAFNNAFAGETETTAAYIQDTWSFSTDWKLIPGVRYEHWRASDGVRAQSGVSLSYPERSDSYWSPKLAIERALAESWTARLSLARAYRMPTVSELFQGRITGTALLNNDPNLRPEKSFSKDLTVERAGSGSRLRLSIYEDDIRDALFSQTNTTVFPTITNIQNVDRVRTRGIEAMVDAQRFLIERLDVSASVARNHAKILENSNNPVSIGKYFYRIPNWRADVVGTYHMMPWLSSTLATRYSGRQYNTLDNTDINPDTFGGTSRYFVVDAKLSLTPSEHTRLGLGVENLTDERYYVFHPYPGRTWYAEAQFNF